MNFIPEYNPPKQQAIATEHFNTPLNHAITYQKEACLATTGFRMLELAMPVYNTVTQQEDAVEAPEGG